MRLTARLAQADFDAAMEGAPETPASLDGLAGDLSIDHPATVAEYIDLLVRMDVLVVIPALAEHLLAGAPKKARKVVFADPFIFHAVRSWIARRAIRSPLRLSPVSRTGRGRMHGFFPASRRTRFTVFRTSFSRSTCCAWGRRWPPSGIRWLEQAKHGLGRRVQGPRRAWKCRACALTAGGSVILARSMSNRGGCRVH